MSRSISCSNILGMSCIVYFMLCSIVSLRYFRFCLSFIFPYILHSLCNPFSFSLLPLDSFVYLWQKGGEYTREYTGVYHHFYITHVYVLRGRNSTSCTLVEGEIHKGDAYTKREKKKYYEKTLFGFVLLYVYFLVALWCLELHFVSVRLNLINHFFGFIPCQFDCNSALRNPVFMWESCKDNVWESVKKSSEMCNSTGHHDWISWLAHDWQVAKVSTRMKHAWELKSHASCCTTRQKSQVGYSVNSRYGLATQSSHEAKSSVHFVWEKMPLRIPYTHQYKYPLYPWNVESFQREF